MNSGTLIKSLIAAFVLIVTAQLSPALAQVGDNVVAIVDGKTIRQSEVDSVATAQLFPLQQQMYAIRKTALENLITRVILEHEAKRQGFSVAELRMRMASGKVEASTAAVETAYAENAAFFAGMSPDEARERLRLDLENQARMKLYKQALSKLRETARIELLLEEPRLPSPLVIDNAFAKGSPGARITLVEFSDFQCPYCRSVQNTVRQLMEAYGAQIRHVFRHLPLEIHEQAFSAARAAFCAGQQQMFWPYHDSLFATQSLSDQVFQKIATDLGMNLVAFNACHKSEGSRLGVLKDVAEARQLGIKATPSFVVNGKLITGAITFDDFKKVLESELNPQLGNNQD